MARSRKPDWIIPARLFLLMMRFSFSSLRVRLSLLVLLSLAPAFGLIFHATQREEFLAAAAGEQKALELARNAATEQRRLISEARRFLGQLAQEYQWWVMDPTKCSALVADQLKRQPQYLNLGVINLKGDIVCSALPLKAPINAADRTYFRRTVETQDFSIGEYQIGRVTGKATVNFGFPEFDDRGRLQAVVFAALDLTVIEQVFVKAKRDEGSVFLMLDQKGTVLSRYPDLEKRVGKPFQDPAILKAIQAKQDEIKGQATGADGIERLYAFTALRSGGEVAGFIGIGIPLKAAFAEAKRNFLNNLVLIGLVSVLILAATWFGSDLFVLRQVNALVSATKRLGSGDLSTRAALPYGQNELGQLARSFDEMADSLQTLTRRNELILTSAGEGIYGVDLEGTTTFINPAAAKMLGYEPSELTGRAMHALAHHSKPDGTPYPKEECPIYAAFTDGAVHHVDDEVFWRRDGTSFPVEYISTPVREDGKLLGGVVTFKDVTERKWSEQERARLFEETERNLERIRALREIDLAITSTLDLRIVLDLLLEKIDSLLTYPTASTIRLLNKESGVLEPVACWNLNEAVWKAAEWRAGRGLANVVFETKTTLMVGNILKDQRLGDHEFFRRYGLVSYLGVPLIAKRETLGVLGFYTKEEHQFSREEIEFLSTLAGQASIAIHNAQLYEQTKRQTVELERSNRVKDEFLSVMSHELRTPLSVIMGYTGLLKEGTLGEINKRQEEALQKVLGRAGEQLKLINDVMQTTQLEARATVLEHLLVDVRELFDKLKSDYGLQLDKRGVSLIWDYPQEPMPIVTDSAKLKQILENLVNNALKFTQEGSVTVSVRKKEDGQQVEFTVADTGVGIPSQKLATIFNKFYQVDSSETRLYGGVGLGLYIVKKFTEMLGGKVDVESEIGKGSTFTVTIPA